ncbi:MAG: 16S rRNA (cytidine(1402)-2'-O)-methyltransferase [Desulfobacterales bacterium]|nr:16S rRNA (cytidine(1402)-2'-O)-methyltransferase [Desulfobacterales bacterium]
MHLNSQTDHEVVTTSYGILYVVATPIGNLEDITFRAIRILKSVDIIAAEDTRHTSILLSHYQIQPRKLIAYHEHNEDSRSLYLVNQIQDGKSVALVSNAGTPLVSDPGYTLIQKAYQHGIQVIPIPGASALLTALCVSGMPVDTFLFKGFLPRKKNKRMNLLYLFKKIETSCSLIFYESPNRINVLLEELLMVFGERYVVIARELTKIHETLYRGYLSEISELFKKQHNIKGECTVILSGEIVQMQEVNSDIQKKIIQLIETHQDKPSKIARDIANTYNIPKNLVYSEILSIQKNNNKNNLDT